MTASGQNTLDYESLLENMGAGILIFDQSNKLILDNTAARHILGTNLVLIRSEGWSAFAMLIDAHPDEHMRASEIRAKAQREKQPVRFSMLLSGSFTPCWLSNFTGSNGQNLTQVLIDKPVWTALTELMSTFRSEARTAINNTNGHATFISKLLQNPPKNISVEQFGERAMGMVNLIPTEMYRLQLLIDLLHRLEIIRTGQLADIIEQTKKKIDLEDYLEDFIEELYEETLVDPSLDADEYRKRLKLDIDEDLYLFVPKTYLRNVLRDILRNAFMYSEPGTSVRVRVTSASQGRHIEFAITDEGCGIRERETERVFEPFQRARQPQVIREYGYGLSLYLTKAEVEAMGGRIWFESTEGVGSTFSFKLPAEHG